jgi:uncharacterized protein (TIGR02757 family)
LKITRSALDELYHCYNRREWVSPDPVEFLYAFNDPGDREIVGILAACLAYGRVAQIHRSIASALVPLTPSPARRLGEATGRSLHRAFAGFKHRFTGGEEVAGLLLAVKSMREEHGSLERCFAAGLAPGEGDLFPALAKFSEKLSAGVGVPGSMFVPSPGKGSACKRLNLFLRWMVRRDAVDPGGWDSVSKSRLLVPLDTHMHRIGLMLGLTSRRQANRRTAVEITESFRKLAPEDPVRYDFALTRSGILKNTDISDFLEKFACRTPSPPGS